LPFYGVAERGAEDRAAAVGDHERDGPAGAVRQRDVAAELQDALGGHRARSRQAQRAGAAAGVGRVGEAVAVVVGAVVARAFRDAAGAGAAVAVGGVPVVALLVATEDAVAARTEGEVVVAAVAVGAFPSSQASPAPVMPSPRTRPPWWSVSRRACRRAAGIVDDGGRPRAVRVPPRNAPSVPSGSPCQSRRRSAPSRR
jgi:hypothetical protein